MYTVVIDFPSFSRIFHFFRLPQLSILGQTPALALTSCVTLCNVLNLSVPQPPPQQNGDNANTDFGGQVARAQDAFVIIFAVIIVTIPARMIPKHTCHSGLENSTR